MFSVCKYVILGFILIVNLAGLVQAEGANQTSNGSSLIAETVANSGPNSFNITTIVLPGESIQAAIQTSLPGNIIEVHSGTYHENINVTKRLVIRGVDVGEGLPVVDAGGNGSAIDISADGVRLENLVVTNASRYGYGAGINAGIKVASSNCTIMGSSAQYCFNGIALSNSDNNTLLNNNLSDNNNGILLSSSTNDTIFGNNLSNNRYCINLSSSTNNTIFGNNLSDKFYSGIRLESSNKNTIFDNHFKGIESGNGIEFYESSNNTLFGNNLSNNDNGISLSASDNNTLRGNNLSSNDDGISLSKSDNNTLLDNNLSSNDDGISLSESDNNTLLNNSLSLNSNGIDLSESDNNTLLGNNLSRNSEGIDLSESDNNTLHDNNLSNNDFSGISLDSSNKNTISNNLFREIKFFGVGVGIDLSESRNNTIIENSLSHNNYGINLYDSESNALLGNNLSNNDDGIRLSSSGHNRLSNNSMSGNRSNFNMRGEQISDFDNDIDSTNLVNGRPIYYIKNATNKMIDPNFMILVGCFNCTNVTVRDLNESSSDASILLVNTHNSRVMENRLRNLENGIQLYFSDGNSISENNVSENNRGIFLSSSNNNTVISNYLSNNIYAVEFITSNNNTFINNELSDNSNCILFTLSNSNSLTGNDLRNSKSRCILFTSSNNNTLNSNNLSNNSNGIELTASENNTLIRNNLSNNNNGISFSSSRNNQLRENLMFGNRRNLNIYGSHISDFDNDIDLTNLINGRPIYYLRDANNETIDSNSNAGLIGCFNCTNITIRGLSISDAETGIGLYKTKHSLVEFNNLTDLGKGIYLYFSNDNTIKFNTINNSHYGIKIEDADNNSVENNSVSNNTTKPIVYDEIRNNKFANNSENEIRDDSFERSLFSAPVSLISGPMPIDVGIEFINDGSNPASEPVEGTDSATSGSSSRSSGGGKSGGSGIEIPKQDLKKPTATEEIGKLIYEQIESLKWGQIVFTPPAKAWKGVPIPIKARISQNLSENISQGLEKFPKTERDKIKVSYEMNVQLDGGNNFDISPKVQKAKIIPESGYAEWDWSATPLREGTHTIKLTATATINLNENIVKEPDIKVYEKDIIVEVDWFREAKKTILGGINWIVLSFVGVLGLGLINWLSGGILNRIKSMVKKEEEVTDESEKTEVED